MALTRTFDAAAFQRTFAAARRCGVDLDDCTTEERKLVMTDSPAMLIFDLASFDDSLPLHDGKIAVRDESGAIVKVGGTVRANRNPLHTALYQPPEQLARLIQRENRRFKDYAQMHPGMAYCSDCHTFHSVKDFTWFKDGRLDTICKAARSRISREQYAQKRNQPIRHYEHRTTARPRASGRALYNKAS